MDKWLKKFNFISSKKIVTNVKMTLTTKKANVRKSYIKSYVSTNAPQKRSMLPIQGQSTVGEGLMIRKNSMFSF